ncbi:MAG: regulatory protein RecX [Proteobacteria bacterium]|nr:regulatory protein RecX [Pseudomonadota bacterium]
MAKGFPTHLIEDELARLVEEQLQDDNRFAESYIRYRAGSGYGPVKIKIELNQRGVEESTTRAAMDRLAIDWSERSRAAWLKKFGGAANDFKERAKHARFLQYRGFTSDQISVLLG